MLPIELVDILEEAEREIKSHPKGELTLPMRRKIWRSFGGSKTDQYSRALPTMGLKRRTKLAELCVKKVFSIWNYIAYDDKRPLEMLDVAQAYLNGEMGYEIVQSRIGTFLTQLERLIGDKKFYTVVPVGIASIKTAAIAIRDESLMFPDKKHNLDEDYDSFSWDPSYHAAMAYCGSEPSENKNKELRQAFWLWYINEAVPEAYLAYKERDVHIEDTLVFKQVVDM